MARLRITARVNPKTGIVTYSHKGTPIGCSDVSRNGKFIKSGILKRFLQDNNLQVPCKPLTRAFDKWS